MPSTESLLRDLLLYILVPLWLAAGFADYLCHRIQHIEHTAGWPESLLHLIMLAELGIGVGAAVLLEVNAGVLALVLLCCIAHEITTWIDLSYANSRRRIPPIEQWVHGLQLVLPWIGFAGLALLHHDQALAVIGMGSTEATWTPRWKDPPLPLAYLATLAFAACALAVLPLLEEWRRSRRAALSATATGLGAASVIPASRPSGRR